MLMTDVPRIDGFDWANLRHGHNDDCLRVYRLPNGDAFKCVMFWNDQTNMTHWKTLRREFTILSYLDHPYIIKPIGWEDMADCMGFRMPYYPVTLAEALPQLDKDMVRRQMAEVVEYLFKNDTVH